MATETPFLSYKVECPICKTINEIETLRVGAYSEDGRDSDFCPQNVTWRSQRYQAYNPLAFFTATCENCFYTREFTNKYRDWKSDNNFRTYRLKQVKDKHLEQLSTADSVIKTMGSAIDLQRFPNETAILKLHLAIYDELLADHPSDLDLGRFYLRIGWLYRDLRKGENPQVLFLRGMMQDFDKKFGLLNNSLDQLRNEREVFTSNLKSQFETEELSTDIKSRMLPFREQFETHLTSLNQQIDQAQQCLDSVGSTIGEYKQATLGSVDEDGSPVFGAHQSFDAFMVGLNSSWSSVVTSELEALEKSVHHYKAAFADGRDISAGAQQIQASYLIAELSRRIGDHDQAKQYFTSTIKFGQDFIYQNRKDQSRTVLARKILELAIEQGRKNLKEAKQ